MAIWPLNWQVIIDNDDDDENWADSRAPSGWRSRLSDGIGNDNGEGEDDTQAHRKGTRKGNGSKNWKAKGKVTQDGKGKGKRKGKGNGTGKGIVKPTAGGDDISRAVAFQVQKEM